MAHRRLVGNVVSQDADAGLYLQTDDGRLLALIAENMATSIPPDAAHAQGRASFEPFLGERVHATGHDAGDTLWSAVVELQTPEFESMVLPSAPDAIAPDGSDVRVLLR